MGSPTNSIGHLVESTCCGQPFGKSSGFIARWVKCVPDELPTFFGLYTPDFIVRHNTSPTATALTACTSVLEETGSCPGKYAGLCRIICTYTDHAAPVRRIDFSCATRVLFQREGEATRGHL
jgi:hypothetical protein